MSRNQRFPVGRTPRAKKEEEKKWGWGTWEPTCDLLVRHTQPPQPPRSYTYSYWQPIAQIRKTHKGYRWVLSDDPSIQSTFFDTEDECKANCRKRCLKLELVELAPDKEN